MSAWTVVSVRDDRPGTFRAVVRSGARVIHLERLTADEVAALRDDPSAGERAWKRQPIVVPLAPVPDLTSHATLVALAERAPARPGRPTA